MDELKHIGVARRSGRYPWGSGKDGYQRNTSIRGHVNALKKQGLTESQIAEGLGYGKKGTSKLRADISLEKAAQRQADSALAQRLKDKGYSYTEIGKRMGRNESSVRSLLDPVMQERALITEHTADMLRRQVAEKGYLDVGAGIENQVGVSRTRLNTSIAQLQKDGYKLQYIREEQPGTGKYTTIKVLTKDDVDYKTLYQNKDKIRGITEWSEDGGRSYLGLEPIANISKNRISVKYAEDGGADMDGVIQLRRGVNDISLGDKRYAQVRIGVDGTHYLKGMAIYADDLPDGVDIVFNTNKKKGTPMMGDKKSTVLKNVEDDPDNPFGSTVRQKKYIDSDGKEKLSALNIVYEEGDWHTWEKTLSSQMLSKQTPELAKQQLNLSLKIKQDEFDEYNSLTNPTVKRKLLETFADECDADAVHLKAAALPRQGSYVILPSTKLKPNEVYAPMFNNGEKVVLIRHPHAGTFEIPELIVNNSNPSAKKIFENAIDAVAINPLVAKRLSGADFDGDSVLVIPNPSSKNKIVSRDPIKTLLEFDPRESYPSFDGMKRMTASQKGAEMGKISNLITDMTIKGATRDEIARAVKHSMVVIDAEKHGLNYKQSFIDNGIAELKKTYQGGEMRGASTLISKAGADFWVDRRQDKYAVDPKSGKKIFKYTDEKLHYIKDPNNPSKKLYVNYPKIDTKKVDPITGKKIFKTDYDNPYFVDPKTRTRIPVSPNQVKEINRRTKSTRMYEEDDAYNLSSGTRIESIYANHANALKGLGDKARKTAINTPPLKYSPSAKKAYAPEVASLLADLSIAISNKPSERQAILLANKVIKTKRQANPDLEAPALKKIRGQALAEARHRVGAKKQLINITPKQWEAIQAGAISNNVLREILNNADLDQIKQYSSPRKDNKLSTAKVNRAKLLFDRGYTQAEVASMLGTTPSMLINSIKGG